MPSPWAKIKKPEPVNLTEIISEEVARGLQSKENKINNESLDIGKQDEAGAPIPNKISYDPQVLNEISDEVPQAILNDSDDSDTIIAKEHDDMLKKVEQKVNGSCKVSISFENYRRQPQNFDFESDPEEEIEDLRDRKDWDRFDALARNIKSIPVCGYKLKENGKGVNKHDLVNSARENADKLLFFPLEFQTGDGKSFTFFNSLKTYSNKEHRIHDKKEKHATAEFSIDEYSLKLLYKMINSSLLERVNGVVSNGKETVIFHATTTDPEFPHAKKSLPKECAIKVFKTIVSEFKQRDYCWGQNTEVPRIFYLQKRIFREQSSRKVAHIGAEKEKAYLMRVKRAGVKCPEVVMLNKNILVMSFIGENHRPAPKLKEVKDMSDADLILAYKQVVYGMTALYHKANLIHADLSEYNILWHNQECYFIDMSQSVESCHENAYPFLYRDCVNVNNFFFKRGVRNVMNSDELFKKIVGFSFNDRVTWWSLEESFKMKPHLVDRPDVESSFTFETAWEKSQSGELPQTAGQSSEEVPKIETTISETEQLKLADPLPA